ncbi:protein THEM6-like isoform X2 [Macrosteles quadrilineatus]|nr:protein THEM6-like isoform X2 [Macrosteles quadrilineatus]XP_054269402.1 protein THEM6-like isoform X2 [Macrosteles quadrilineatus]
MVLCYILAGVLAVILILYWSFEVHYFIRMGLTVFNARVFKRKVHILDSTSVTGVCLSTDVDTLLYHMNNARYLRELDFARVDFYERTDLYRTIRAKGGAVVQGACTIRYRRFVRPFSVYTITSKIVYWDQNSIYMEHRFITPKDEFVRAIALCRQRLINVSAEDVMTELLSNGAKAADPERGLEKPECPLEVLRWNESNEISSANLRNGC